MTESNAKNISAIPIDGFSNVRITSLWSFLQSVDWSEPWLMGLLAFHVLCFAFTILSCKYYRIQICHFLLMVGLVYSAEYLNELAAMNWRSFSKFQYFDSKGMFISLVYSVPLLLNTVIIVFSLTFIVWTKNTMEVNGDQNAVWVWRTFSTMTELKILQLKRKAARENHKKMQ